MTTTPEPMDVDREPPTSTSGDATQTQRRGSTTSGTSASAPPPVPPLPPALQKGPLNASPPNTSAPNPAASGDPQTTPLPPSPAPTPTSRSTTHLTAVQEKARLEKARLAASQANPQANPNAPSALSAPPPGSGKAAQVAATPNNFSGDASYDAEPSGLPPPSYIEAGTAAPAPTTQASYVTNLASPGPGSFFVQTPAGYVPVQQPPPGVALYVMAGDGQFYPAQLAPAPAPAPASASIVYPPIPVNALSPVTAAAQGLLPSPAPDPATATLRALINPDTRGSPPDTRSSAAQDYFDKDFKNASGRSARPNSASFESSRTSHQKPTRQTSHPATRRAGDFAGADPDDELRADAVAAQNYMRRSRDANSRMDEDDEDDNFLNPDENLARRLEHRLDEPDNEEEDSGDELPDHPPGYRPPPRQRRGVKPILFYEENEKYYEFTNFAPYPVKFRGRDYPTSEHLFQARKFLDDRPLLAEHIRRGSERPRFAFTEARRFAPETRPDWKEISIDVMEEILELKFTQHEVLRRLLLSTGERYLIENAGKNDDFWGNGADGQGRNELGLALMRLRSKLREKEPIAPAAKGKGKGRR